MQSGDLTSVQIATVAGGVEFQVKTVPNASRSRVVGALGNALKVAVAAPPEAGKANAAVIALLTSVLEVSRGAVEIRDGKASPRKRIFVARVKAEEVRTRLAAATSKRSPT